MRVSHGFRAVLSGVGVHELSEIRRKLVLIVTMTVSTMATLAGCLGPESEQCGSLVCPRGQECDGTHALCVWPEQLVDCLGETDGTPCSVGEDDWFVCDQDVCIPKPCPNGVLDPGEECDDGNEDDRDDCRNNCELPYCGDGVQRTGMEECDGDDFGMVTCDDLGFSGGTVVGCMANCVADRSGCVGGCGNGVLEVGEECDDGSALSDIAPDGCRTNCRQAWCGDDVVDTGEECDKGPDNSNTVPDACRSDCRQAWCGDGVQDSGEECDDGNAAQWDGCDTCTISEFQVNTYTSLDQEEPAVAMVNDGRFVVVWTSGDQDGDNAGVFAQLYDVQGTPAGVETQVSTSSSGTQWKPAVAMAGAGSFVATWRDDGQNGNVIARRFDAQGVPLGGEFQVNTNASTGGELSRPAVATASDGRFVVTWQSGGLDGSQLGVFARRFSAQGSPLGGEFQVNTYTDDNQEKPAIAMADDGRLVVVWQSPYQDESEFGIYAQLYDAQGSPQGGNFQVNTYTPGHQHSPVVSMAGDGRFVVAWESWGQDGDGGGIFAQRYDSLGDSMGGELQVNTYITGYQALPSVAVADDGRFVVAWQSWEQDGNGGGVYLQRFDAQGVPLGGEYQVNILTSGTQAAPAVSMAGDGRFVVAWESQGQDGDGYGVFAQRFDTSGTALGIDP